MPPTKATKKFEKKYLPDVLKRRKESKKIKQKVQLKEKRKQRRAQEAEQEDGKPSTKGETGANALSSMSVDDFFAGGFEIPSDPKAKSKKRKRTVGPELEDTATERKVKTQRSDDESAAESEDDAGAHKAQLEALAKNDPEFYRHLKENEPELLDFDEDADLAALDALSDSEEEATPKNSKKKASKEEDDMSVDEDEEIANEVTVAMVEKWSVALTKQHSLRAAKEVVVAFRAATHIDEEDAGKFKYTVTDADATHALFMCALQNIPSVLQHHMPVQEKKGGKVQIPTENKKITPLVRSFVSSVQHLLEITPSNESARFKVIFEAILAVVPYLLSHKKLVKEIIKTVVTIWSDSSNNDATRIAAFLILRRLTVIGDPGIRETVLKSTYKGFLQGSRNTTVHTIQGVNLMKNSAAELWGIDANVGYTTGFTFIRQLAILLRSSITNRSKDAYKTIYNWQYVHSLDFWSRVLAAFCDPIREAESGKQSPLRPLIYPVVQVTLGALRLIPTAQYFPLRFQLIRSLLRISLASTTYIPLGASLFEVLNSAEMKKPPKQSTLRALEFSTSIRTPQSYLRTRIYQDGVGEQVLELLSEFSVQWTKSIAFPELALPILVMLKRWLKEMNSKTSGNKNSKVNSMIALLVQKLEANSRWVEERRTKVDFAPNNRAGVESFLKETEWETSPLGAYVVTQRKQREEKQRMIEKAKKDEERDRARDKKKREETEMEEADGFEDDENEEEEVAVGSEDEDDEVDQDEEEDDDEDEEMQDEAFDDSD